MIFMKYRLVAIVNKPLISRSTGYKIATDFHGRINLKVLDPRKVSLTRLCNIIREEDLPLAIQVKVVVDRTNVEKYLVLVPERRSQHRGWYGKR